MDCETLIVGGGLTGLRIAFGLTTLGRDFRLLEARPRLGGRVLSQAPDGLDVAYDLGPAWIWPSQPRVRRLLSDLGLEYFPQYVTGKMVYEEANGSLRRDLDFAMMADALRVEGGVGQLIQALAATLPAKAVHLDQRVEALERHADHLVLSAQSGEGTQTTWRAKRVILALPPRLIAKLIFRPALPTPLLEALEALPTWMAGHAKVIALYDQPFWRQAGLSGEALSRLTPLTEIHDASPGQGGPYALFGFVGLPAAQRRGQDTPLRQAAVAQLARLFGAEAEAPLAVLVKDWAFDPCTATAADHRSLTEHPRYGLAAVDRGLWTGRLWLSATETAMENGGLLEGALEAAEALLDRLARPA